MTEPRRTFADRYISGEIRPEDAESALMDAIDARFNLPDDDAPLIYQYLGLTSAEYRRWVGEPHPAIWEILDERK